MARKRGLISGLCGALAALLVVSVSNGNPVASAKAEGALQAEGRKLDAIRARGKLLCGVNTGLLGFSTQAGSGEINESAMDPA